MRGDTREGVKEGPESCTEGGGREGTSSFESTKEDRRASGAAVREEEGTRAGENAAVKASEDRLRGGGQGRAKVRAGVHAPEQTKGETVMQFAPRFSF